MGENGGSHKSLSPYNLCVWGRGHIASRIFHVAQASLGLQSFPSSISKYCGYNDIVIIGVSYHTWFFFPYQVLFQFRFHCLLPYRSFYQVIKQIRPWVVFLEYVKVENWAQAGTSQSSPAQGRAGTESTRCDLVLILEQALFQKDRRRCNRRGPLACPLGETLE